VWLVVFSAGLVRENQAGTHFGNACSLYLWENQKASIICQKITLPIGNV